MPHAQIWSMIFDIEIITTWNLALETRRLQWNKRVLTGRLLDGGILVFAKVSGERSRMSIGRDN